MFQCSWCKKQYENLKFYSSKQYFCSQECEETYSFGIDTKIISENGIPFSKEDRRKVSVKLKDLKAIKRVPRILEEHNLSKKNQKLSNTVATILILFTLFNMISSLGFFNTIAESWGFNLNNPLNEDERSLYGEVVDTIVSIFLVIHIIASILIYNALIWRMKMRELV